MTSHDDEFFFLCGSLHAVVIRHLLADTDKTREELGELGLDIVRRWEVKMGSLFQPPTAEAESKPFAGLISLQPNIKS